MTQKNEMYDVAIMGTGLAGTVMGAILARHHKKVLLIDAGRHPRFAVGESTIPYTSALMRVSAAWFDVPELAHLASFNNVFKHISRTSGLKRNFGFVYHREGRPQDPSEVNQFIIPGDLNVECHYFRQDVDAYMLLVAVNYGATVHQETRIANIDIDSSRVLLTSDKGQEFKARFLIDASGYRSPLATKLQLRPDPPPFKHHARSLFTHMLNVTPYDAIAPKPPRGLRNPSKWNEGTLHHLFEGGWLWVIPFNNHKRSQNPLVSVGLNLDPRVYPRPQGVSPEEEFRSFIARFPLIERQFKDAKAAREWVATDRMQYGATQTVGERWALTSHAAGFIDPLFSRGMTNTFEVTNALAWRLLEALDEDDFSVERFEYLERLHQGLLDLNDEVVYLSYVSFKEFHMWNAAYRVWGLGAVLGTGLLEEAYLDFLSSRDVGVLKRLENSPRTGIPLPLHPPLHQFLDEAGVVAADVASGRVSPYDGGESIFRMLADADFVPPVFGFHDPKVRYYHPTPQKVPSTLLWSYTRTPPEIGRTIRAGLKAFAHRSIVGE